MTAEGWEYFDVAANVGVHAWGRDLPACFRQCALGVFNLIVPLAAVEPVEDREVAAQGDSPDVLLVNWINECLYLHDIEGFVLHDLGPPRFEGARVDARRLGRGLRTQRDGGSAAAKDQKHQAAGDANEHASHEPFTLQERLETRRIMHQCSGHRATARRRGRACP